MSRSDLLYVRGMNKLDVSDVETAMDNDEDEDIWDDNQLNLAYDKALRIANIEVAKRIAMSTNNNSKAEKDADKTKHKTKSKSSQVKKWAPGMACRAIYEGDGLEYEAFVQRLINDKECVVKFLGYDNSEIVGIGGLKASHGRETQQRQIEQAILEKDDSDVSLAQDMEIGSDRVNSPGSTDRSSRKRDRKKKKRDRMPTFQLPDFTAIPMPDIPKLRQMGQMDMPMLPPPPMPFLGTSSDRPDCEEEAIQSMLVSWYMSGYHAGLYQGLKRAKENKRRKD